MKRAVLLTMILNIIPSIYSPITADASIDKSNIRIPLLFEENKGQINADIRFIARYDGYTLYLSDDNIIFRFDDRILEMSIINADAKSIKGLELGGYSHYYKGNKEYTYIPNYKQVIYDDIYNGIDLIFYESNGNLKYDFIVEPYADYNDIKLRFNTDVKVEDDRLIIDGIINEKPVIYQEVDGIKQYINGRYVIDNGIVRFEIDDYDESKQLVIDPLIYSTYLGGSYIENGFDIAVDNDGNAYITGNTASYDFPIKNGYDLGKGGSDVFVTKLNTSGNGLVYSTYLGGNNNEIGRSIAVDNDGNAYVTGVTHSDDFPTKNAYDNNLDGVFDAFVTKFNYNGQIIYSTYLGGSASEYGNDIAVDNDGNAYVTGWTISTTFPTLNAYDNNLGGTIDAFVTKFNYNGQIIYSTYLGGSNGGERGYDIAVDNNGNVYITGYTDSDDFPTKNAYDNTNNGYFDAFVTKFNADSTLGYSTYLGGDNDDYGYGIAVDNSNNAYITGYTYSSNFPIKNGYDLSGNGGSDVFVTKLNSSGNGLVYSTYFGGSVDDEGYGIAVDNDGNAYITGYTRSINLPIMNAFNTSWNGLDDAFVTKFNADGTLGYSTYLGGSDDDYGYGIAVDNSNNAYITGYTYSSNFPILNAYQDSYNGDRDAFVTKLREPIAASYIKAMQNGNVIDLNNPGILGVDIDCVGGINAIANKFECKLLDDSNNIIGSQYTTSTIDCSTVGFPSNYTCFRVTFSALDFNQGIYSFNSTFTYNENIIDIVRESFRVKSFLVIPETAIGAIAIIASIFGVFVAYSIRKR